MKENPIPRTIENIKISGFKSLRNVNLELNNLNVFIGANGSGKSNFVSFFKMLQFMIESDGLKLYVARNGGADFRISLL